MKLQIKFSH